jgi:hypothetical protein
LLTPWPWANAAPANRAAAMPMMRFMYCSSS